MMTSSVLEHAGERLDRLVGDVARRHHDPGGARLLELRRELLERRRAVGAVGFQCLDGVRADVIADEPMPVAHQTPGRCRRPSGRARPSRAAWACQLPSFAPFPGPFATLGLAFVPLRDRHVTTPAVEVLHPARMKRGHVRSVILPPARTKGGCALAARQETDGSSADALVVFGITGDLARVMTFRSLYRLEQRKLLQCPIVGVAGDDWTVDHLRRARARLDRADRRAARPGGLRPLRCPPLLRAG